MISMLLTLSVNFVFKTLINVYVEPHMTPYFGIVIILQMERSTKYWCEHMQNEPNKGVEFFV